MIRPLDDIADLFDDLAPVLFKVCVADGGIVGRRDTDDDHRLFAAGKFDDLLDIANTRVLQRQLALLDCGLQVSSAFRLPIVKTGISGSGQSLQLGEGKHARRGVQLFRFWQKIALHRKSAGSFVFCHDGGNRFFADRTDFFHRVFRCALPTEEKQIHAHSSQRGKRDVIGRFQIAQLLHSGRRRRQAKILRDKVGVHVDSRGDLRGQMGSVEPLERLTAVGELSPGDNDGHDLADAAVIDHEFLAGQRKLRLQNKRGKIVERKASLEFQ